MPFKLKRLTNNNHIIIIITMLNGKFYTGLTAGQLNRPRTGVPDRLKSSFFWPDETDSQPSTQFRRGSVQTRASRERGDVVPAAVDITSGDNNSKQMYHKQLESKIEFFDDHLKATPKLRRRGQQNQSSATKASAVTASNKFNDIATAQDISDIAANIRKPSAPAAAATSRSAASHKQSAQAQPTRRKITFDEPPKQSQQRGILKNNNESTGAHQSTHHDKRSASDYKLAPIPVYKQNIVAPRQRTSATRLQLSKSMDNFARLEITGVSVGSSATGATAPQTKRNNVEHERDAKHRHSTERDEPEVGDYPEREYFEKWDTGEDYAPVDDRNDRRSYEKEERAQERSDERPATIVHRVAVESQRRNVNQRNMNTIRADEVDVGYAKHYEDVAEAPRQTTSTRMQRASTVVPDASTQVAAGVGGGGGGISASNHSNGRRYFANEAAVRAHSHLRSNIFFNDNAASDFGGGGGVDRPRSVRESAVARVGVGLPNI